MNAQILIIKLTISLFSFCLLIFGISYSIDAYVEHRGDSLERAWKILRQDTVLGWRLKENLNVQFYGQKVSTDAEGFRISEINQKKTESALMLGPSSMFGWGVSDNETYAALLPFQTTNLAQIGHSSHQGKNLLATYIANHRDMNFDSVFLGFGINDLDYFRFYDSTGKEDKAYFNHAISENPFLTQNFPLLFLLKKAAEFRKSVGLSCPPRIENQRVLLADFLLNYDELIQMLRPVSKKIFILSTALKPNPQFENARQQASLSEAIKEKVNNKISLHECALANKLFAEWRIAIEQDLRSDVIKYNTELKKFTQNKAVVWIDTQKNLNMNDFIDGVHFSKSGHIKIKENIINSISLSH